MKKIFLGLGIVFSLNVVSQPAPNDFKLVFVDFKNHIIIPDITISSITVFDELVYSDTLLIKADSLFINGKKIPDSVKFYYPHRENDNFLIYSLNNPEYWLDYEYYLKVEYKNTIMHLNLFTLGTFMNDTIKFKPGQFLYMQKEIFTPDSIYYSKILIEYDNELPPDLCLFNCEGKVDSLNAEWISSIRTEEGGYYFGYRDFIFVNHIPIGYAIVDKRENINKLFYFDNKFIILLKNHY